MTEAQYAAACERIRAAGPLGHGRLYDPGTERCCALGALLDGPDGAQPDTLIRWDGVATDALDDDPSRSFTEALPMVAVRFLAERYGLSTADGDELVGANDAADSLNEEGQTRADVVLAQLARIFNRPGQ